uniref:Uncharacterized protein n=1 Tax=Trichogramma kaykai TaxID=54128 RepID=A0ABD2WNJ9_9HYME
MDIQKVNQLARSVGRLPLKKIEDLVVNQDYMVTSIKKASTKYGPKTVLYLDQEFQIFLPKQVSDALLDTYSDIKTENLYVMYDKKCIQFIEK